MIRKRTIEIGNLKLVFEMRETCFVCFFQWITIEDKLHKKIIPRNPNERIEWRWVRGLSEFYTINVCHHCLGRLSITLYEYGNSIKMNNNEKNITIQFMSHPRLNNFVAAKICYIKITKHIYCMKLWFNIVRLFQFSFWFICASLCHESWN